jgi:DNA-binding transcriptional regulator YiaG
MNENQTGNSVGDRIRTLRQKTRLTHQEFYQHTGLSAHLLEDWESGKRVPDNNAIELLSTLFILKFDIHPSQASPQALLYGSR